VKITRKISPKVVVIILNFDGVKYLKRCLSSLMSQTYSNYQVVVCDNASTDGSANYVKLNFPSVILIQNKENLGFSKGNNKALKLALDQGADYIQLFNNDTIVEKDVIESLVTTAKSNEKIGIVGPKILDFENRDLIQEMGMTCDKFGFPAAMEPRKERVFEAFYVSGCAMLIKQEVLRKIGHFDEKYFMFSEDLDLCWRARLEGYTVVVNKAAKIYHASGGSIVGGTIKNRSYTTNLTRVFLRERNTLRTLIKNYSLGNLIRIMPLYLAILSIECFTWAFLLKPSVCISLFKAIWWNIEVLKDTLNHRQRIQAFRKIGDQEIMKKMIKGYAKLQIFRLVGIPRFKNL
jgi:GT2 family glycosyltransferase